MAGPGKAGLGKATSRPGEEGRGLAWQGTAGLGYI